MLRYQHMPSDFNPKFLILGEGSDFAALAAVLRRYAQDNKTVMIDDVIVPRPKGLGLTISPGDPVFGLHPADDLSGGFIWSLNGYQAGVIAERLDVLAASETINASDLFELGSEDEIPVAVSLGEFPEAYLDTRGP